MRYTTHDGFIFNFGFDVANDCENPNLVCWNDPERDEWVSSVDNKAGALLWSGAGRVHSVREDEDGSLIASYPGGGFFISRIGSPFWFGIREHLI